MLPFSFFLFFFFYFIHFGLATLSLLSDSLGCPPPPSALHKVILIFNSRKVRVLLQVPSSTIVLKNTDNWKSFFNFRNCRDLSGFYFLFAVAVYWHGFPQSFKVQPHIFIYLVASFFLCILWRGGSRKRLYC